VTGEQTKLSDSIASQVAEIKKHTDLPVAVGFGISNPEQATEVGRHADAVVVGSAIVRRIAEHGKDPGLARKDLGFCPSLGRSGPRGEILKGSLSSGPRTCSTTRRQS